jgi:two-component system, response regulator PdtaR
MSAAEMTNVEVPTILVVEDEFIIRTEVAHELRDAGYTVVEAADSSEALELLATCPEISLVFTDIAMPGPMDGNDLIRLVRIEYPHLILVAATATTVLGLVEGVLRKPYDAADAVALVHRLLRVRFGRRR